MADKARNPRNTSFSPDELKFLKQWSEKEGQTAVAESLGVGVKTIYNWTHNVTAGPDHSFANDVLRNLHRQMGVTAAAEPIDPITEMQCLFDSGQRLCFEAYNPLQALVRLGRIVHHTHAMQIPAETLLKHYVGILTIYRQSMYAGEGHFLAISQHCLERLSKLRPSDKGESLAALVCAVAWELTAVNAQRGHATECYKILNEIDCLIRERRWDDYLPEGKSNSMIRLQHWANVIAPPDFDQVKKLLKGHNPIDALNRARISNWQLHLNALFQKFLELLRVALESPDNDAEQALQFFNHHLRVTFEQIARQIASGDVMTLSQIATPSTALALAFHTSVLSALISAKETEHLLEQSRHIYSGINRISHGSVILQRTNSRSMKFVEGGHGARLKNALPDLTFTHDFSPHATRTLLETVRQLLDTVDACLPNHIAV